MLFTSQDLAQTDYEGKYRNARVLHLQCPDDHHISQARNRQGYHMSWFYDGYMRCSFRSPNLLSMSFTQLVDKRSRG